ncbi:cytochrome c biogenesis protein ResB [Bacteriovorax sp. Seq25_V]|uniref:cytochrome c biogenesis protein ResB n=1 Tax=Bacteriovorax sp. Seq25_V TaxID=1201288 RepID=UPI00038A30F3|nr:cytochrome c biogenesis protein ResB [Bacteriovorax sp. Seq25_V]EQC48031.1 ResB-like domain protein [Bacteriovorax sp. Seq25_V]
MQSIYHKIEKTIGGLKFAVVIILIFTIMMIIGTFMESWYGTDYANRLIYKTPLFMLLQFFMFLSILFATLIRLPLKKRLYGFYVIHTGLIIIGIGSFATYIAGIDGTIHLNPMTPTRQIVLNDDVIEIISEEDNKRATLNLPYVAKEKELGIKYNDIEVVSYLPFAEKKLEWVKESVPTASSNTHSSSYNVANPNVAQDFTLSLHPEAYDFKASLTMGLLNITYLPHAMIECFKQNNPSGLIIWDSRTAKCSTPEELKIPIKETSTQKRFFAFREKDTVYSFIPDVSPWALDAELKPISGAPVRVFSKKLFEEKPHLFLFGEQAAFFEKDEKKWVIQEFNDKKKMDLPWMGFELTLLKHSNELVPTYIPVATTPIQSKGALIKGEVRAAKINIRGQTYWVTSERPVSLLIDGKKVDIYMTKKSFLLPFELTLSKFKMDKDPGTNNPASYESFVTLFKNNGTSEHHVYMNNPLKYDGFTFYQASYSQDEQTGQYSSTLSVNVDQGRFLKYLGSLLLVFGATWHYYLNNRKKTKENDILGLKA